MSSEQTCPTCGPTTTEQHPRLLNIVRCTNCKEHLVANVITVDSMIGDHLGNIVKKVAVRTDATIERMLNMHGTISPEERARRDAERDERRAEDKRLTAEARTALGLIQHPVARVVLDLHKEAGEYYRHCEGCDFGGFEAEEPEYPCRTVVVIAKHFAIEMPERWQQP